AHKYLLNPFQLDYNANIYTAVASEEKPRRQEDENAATLRVSTLTRW
ncbi:MAG: hypothetical protein PWQ07_1176, partial [Kosmotoga sp.]|nr:hypothetical protein [Kosmotoga sp.]